MSCLGSQSISKQDQVYIVLMLDDLVQGAVLIASSYLGTEMLGNASDDRKRVKLFRAEGQLDDNLEILMKYTYLNCRARALMVFCVVGCLITKAITTPALTIICSTSA